MAKIKLTPGIRYLTRTGDVTTPLEQFGDVTADMFPFSAVCSGIRRTFKPNGTLTTSGNLTPVDLIESLPDRILRSLLSSTISGYVDAATGLPYPLVDALSDENGTIASGEARLRELAVKLAEEIFLTEKEADELLGESLGED